MQESRVCNPQLKHSSCQLQSGQGVLFNTLQLQSCAKDYTENGEQQRLKVVALLGSGGSSEAYAVQLLPASSCELGSTAGAVSAAAATPCCNVSGSTAHAGNTSGDSSGMCRTHMVLKVPLSWDSVSNKAQYAAAFSDGKHFNSCCIQQRENEYALLTKLAGACGITRCHGYGNVKLTTSSDIGFLCVACCWSLRSLAAWRSS
jgi:hypothetical protein